MKTATLAPIVGALSEAYATIQQREGLPPAVVIVKRDPRAWGHFTPSKLWSAKDGEKLHEIMISGENLARGARAVLGTLLHEGAHAKNHAEDVRGTDTNGRHNKKFKAQAEAFGLTITENKNGWSETEVSDQCAERWADVLDLIEQGITIYAQGMATVKTKGTSGGTEGGEEGGEDTPKARNKNNLKAVCPCGNIIRLSQKVMDLGVTCKKCGEDYKATE